MAMESVILVDKNDVEIGTEEKMKAHQNGGILHRAFSVFIFNGRGEMLLQQRAEGKYHCGGLWTNTCCSHQRPDESMEDAVHRKLKQEMGFDTKLKEIFKFIYRAQFGNGMTEHELDHVFVGRFDGKVVANPDEAEGFRWANIAEVGRDVAKNPELFTPWFRMVLDKVAEWYKENKGSL